MSQIEQDIENQKQKIIGLMNRCSCEPESKEIKKLSRKLKREQKRFDFTMRSLIVIGLIII